MGSVMDQPRPWEEAYASKSEPTPQITDVLKKTDEQLRFEKDIAELIGKETMMNNTTGPEREAPDIEHVRMNEFIADQQKHLNILLDQAYTEQAWWNDRVHSLERVRESVNALDVSLNGSAAPNTILSSRTGNRIG